MNLPDVGRNLTDHPRWSLVWSVNDTSTTEMYWRNNTLQADALAEWSANRTGYIASTVLNHIGFSRVGEDLLEKEPCAGNLTAHYELIFAVSQVPRGHINRCLTASSSPERKFSRARSRQLGTILLQRLFCYARSLVRSQYLFVLFEASN